MTRVRVSVAPLGTGCAAHLGQVPSQLVPSDQERTHFQTKRTFIADSNLVVTRVPARYVTMYLAHTHGRNLRFVAPDVDLPEVVLESRTKGADPIGKVYAMSGDSVHQLVHGEDTS